MDYLKIYNKIIERSKNRTDINGYFEIHHIIPRSLGGTDTENNLTKLTLKEHYICHMLLVDIYPNSIKLKYAFWMMASTTYIAYHRYNSGNIYRCDGYLIKRIKYFSENNIPIVSGKMYEYAKSLYIEHSKGIKRSQKQCDNISLSTKKAMYEDSRIKKFGTGAKNSKWYHDKKTNECFKWFPGDNELNMNKYSWGRGKMSESRKKKISEIQNKPRKLWINKKLNVKFQTFSEYCYSMPDGWSCEKFNYSEKSIISMRKLFINVLRKLQIKRVNELGLDIKYKYKLCYKFYEKNTKFAISPALFEICEDILYKYLNNDNIEDMLEEQIYMHINEIQFLNKKYLNLDIINKEHGFGDEYISY